LIPYNSNCCFKDNNSYIYSCDNIRLKALVGEDEDCQNGFHCFFDNPKNLRISDVVTRVSLGKYRYMWNVSCDKTTYTVLYWFNGYDNAQENKRSVILDFNPNKMNDEELKEISYLLRFLVDVQIVRCDIAVDIPIPRKYVHLIKDNRTYEYQDHNENGITEYLGSRNNTNFVKVYDKSRESSLDEAITRVEITCEPVLSEFIKHSPTVLIEHEQISLELLEYDNLNSTHMAFVSVLKELDVQSRIKALKSIQRRLRAKLSPYVLSDTYRLEFDKTCVDNVFRWLRSCVYNKTFNISSQS